MLSVLLPAYFQNIDRSGAYIKKKMIEVEPQPNVSIQYQTQAQKCQIMEFQNPRTPLRSKTIKSHRDNAQHIHPLMSSSI